MAGTVTFILGLYGSGKSHLAKSLGVSSIFESGFLSNHTQQHERLFAALRAGFDCAVVDIAFTERTIREAFLAVLKASVPDVQVRWKCFENDPIRSNRNCRRRRDRDAEGEMALNRYWTRVYSYPDGAEVIPVA